MYTKRDLDPVATRGRQEEMTGMRSFIVEAKSLESAQGILEALANFGPAVTGNAADGYTVSVDVGSSDQAVLSVLDALESHVLERDDGPAKVELDGRQYTLHPGDALPA